MSIQSIREVIRDIPDFPRPGVAFKDITPVLLDRDLLRQVVELMSAPYREERVSHVVAIESRGFLLGAPIAVALGAGLVPIRKPGKLPHHRERIDYALEYGTDALEIHRDALSESDRVLVVDDVLATGGTAAAAGQLVQGRGSALVGYGFLIELGFLHGRGKLAGRRVEALLHYA